MKIDTRTLKYEIYCPACKQIRGYTDKKPAKGADISLHQVVTPAGSVESLASIKYCPTDMQGYHMLCYRLNPNHCATCGGLGYLTSHAENRGGEIVGPDDRPCPECRGARDEDDRFSESYDE